MEECSPVWFSASAHIVPELTRERQITQIDKTPGARCFTISLRSLGLVFGARGSGNANATNLKTAIGQDVCVQRVRGDPRASRPHQRLGRLPDRRRPRAGSSCSAVTRQWREELLSSGERVRSRHRKRIGRWGFPPESESHGEPLGRLQSFRRCRARVTGGAAGFRHAGSG